MSMCFYAKRGEEASLRDLASDPGKLRDYRQDRDGTFLDLHKSWHIFHYLFTGRVDGGEPPANALMSGGTPIGKGFGYGAPRLLDLGETKSFAAFLSGLTPEKLIADLNLEEMAAQHVYCADPDDEEITDDVEHFFPQLKDFAAQAARSGEAVLMWLM